MSKISKLKRFMNQGVTWNNLRTCSKVTSEKCKITNWLTPMDYWRGGGKDFQDLLLTIPKQKQWELF